MIWHNAGRLFFLLLLTYTVGYIGSTFVTPDALMWYHDLMLPALNPPDHWFGMVWIALYGCMALSAWIVWGKATPRPFVLLLAFNLIWPFIFFYLQAPIWAFFDIVVMMILTLCTIYQFGRVSKMSGWLMVPVLLWTCFALYLNGYVAIYNTPLVGWWGLL